MKALKYLGGKVHLARLTHPGGAVCLTSLKGTKVSSVKCSDKSSFVHSFVPVKQEYLIQIQCPIFIRFPNFAHFLFAKYAKFPNFSWLSKKNTYNELVYR